MKVISVNVRQPPEVLSHDVNVVVLSHDGQIAHTIIECGLRTVTVFMPGDEEFAEKARSYGFKSPQVSSLDDRSVHSRS